MENHHSEYWCCRKVPIAAHGLQVIGRGDIVVALQFLQHLLTHDCHRLVSCHKHLCTAATIKHKMTEDTELSKNTSGVHT